ncbi:MAG: DNA-3-methyladenine glycosylase 2 family protein [Bacteroidales bacterium]|nr:DNA-3-methyladenine glycosylase 2 family protein [Bacteroidales bacterium]
MGNEYFIYSQIEIDYLKSKDKKLAEVIDKVGMIQRAVIPDLFGALINSIIGQQISTKAHQTIWERFQNFLVTVTPKSILEHSDNDLQSLGLSFRKVEYIKNIAAKVEAKELDLIKLQTLTDEEVCVELSSLKGIGIWTAEMIMLFSMQRKNIVSYGDLAIIRGMRMLYHHREITPEKFNKYKRRYSPCGSVASLYLWAIAGGVIPEMKDYAPQKKKK